MPSSSAARQRVSPELGSGAGWTARVAVVVGLAAPLFLACGDGPGRGASTPTAQMRGTGGATSTIEIPDPPTGEMLSLAAETIGDARKTLERAPSSAAAWGNFGEVCDAHKLYDAAAIAYGRAHELAPAEFRWAYLLAVVEDFRGRGTEAIVRLFEQAIECNAIYPPLFLRYGDALVRQGELARAKTAYGRAIELDANFAMAHRGLGQTLLALGELAPAKTALERAAELEPEDGVVFAALAQLHHRLGDKARAEAASRKASELPRVLGAPDPVRFSVERRAGTPGTARKRALDAMREGRFAVALRDARFLVEVEPEDVLYRLWLGTCLIETGAVAAAGPHFERAVELDSGHPEPFARYGAWLDAVGRWPEAARQWARAAELAPEEASFVGRHAIALAKAGQLDRAFAAFERAEALGQNDAELYHTWGTALMGRDAAAAVSRFEHALELGGDNAGTLYNLGLSLEALGRTGEAEQRFQQSAELDPQGPAARRAAGG